jgi:hypothetical protein
MPAPTLTTTGERLHDALSPLATEDEANGYALAHFLSALAAMFDEIADLSRDQDDGAPGWSPVFDPDAAPADFLPFLAQFVGVQLPPNLDEAGQRLRIKETDGFKRGTPTAIMGAARQHLVGPGGDGWDATVYLIERHGSPYAFTVTTLESETPDETKVLAALLEQKPAGLILSYSTIVGGDLQTLRDTHLDLAEIAADFTDLDDIRSDPSQT